MVRKALLNEKPEEKALAGFSRLSKHKNNQTAQTNAYIYISDTNYE